jgi:tRNA-splicing ligase RtcB
MADFTREMSNVYSTSVSESTLDEAPMAYKDMESIVSNIGDTVYVIERIVPVYNFKASDVVD